MHVKNSLGAWDYIVIAFTMAVSIAIGFYFRFTGSRQKTTNEFLMAGRNMNQFPAIFSLVVTKLSAIAIIGEPSDIYMFGTQRCIAFVFIFIGSFVTAYIYLPVYFGVGASTIYEFLERRFGKRTRKLVSVFCYIQTLLNMSVVIYTPAIALSAVTEFSTETSIVLTGGVCILFSSMGGLKAVMWADVFQAVMMYGCLFTVLIKAVTEAGGPAEVYKAAYESDRMDFFKFHADPQIPYTFWNSISYGVQFGIAHSVNQMEVQRLLAVKDLKSAQSASLWTSLPSFVMSFLTTSAGLALYAVFKNCDPLSKEGGIGLTKPDQIVPYYIVSRLTEYPGLPGLCISGILSASISSLSSAVNSLSTIFVDDFIGVYLSQQRLSKLKINTIAKVLVVFHGIVIIGLAFFTSNFQSVLQGVVVLDGMLLGPTLGLYTLGVLTQSASETGTLIGLLSGAVLSGWIGLGSSFFGDKYEGKPIGTSGCDASSWNVTIDSCCNSGAVNGTTEENDSSEYIFPLYRISYMWTYCIGAACTVIIGYISSWIIRETGCGVPSCLIHVLACVRSTDQTSNTEAFLFSHRNATSTQVLEKDQMLSTLNFSVLSQDIGQNLFSEIPTFLSEVKAIKTVADCLLIVFECVIGKIYSHFYIYCVRVEVLKEFCNEVDTDYHKLLGYSKTSLAIKPS